MNIDIPKYNPENGLQLCWNRGFVIKVFVKNEDVVIAANREGLVSLANHMLNLAQTEVPHGAHLHFDEYNSLEDGSVNLIIEKL